MKDKKKNKELDCWKNELRKIQSPSGIYFIDELGQLEVVAIENFIKKLLTQQRTELLEEILEENFCDLDGTYDYDGIAKSVIKLAKKLAKEITRKYKK